MRLLGCSAAAEAREVYLSPSQSEGDHLLGLWADCPSTGCWFQDLCMRVGMHACVCVVLFVFVCQVRSLPLLEHLRPIMPSNAPLVKVNLFVILWPSDNNSDFYTAGKNRRRKKKKKGVTQNSCTVLEAFTEVIGAEDSSLESELRSATCWLLEIMAQISGTLLAQDLNMTSVFFLHQKQTVLAPFKVKGRGFHAQSQSSVTEMTISGYPLLLTSHSAKSRTSRLELTILSSLKSGITISNFNISTPITTVWI